MEKNENFGGEKPSKTGYVFDPKMCLHDDEMSTDQGKAIQRVYQAFSALNLLRQCVKVDSRKATMEELKLCHDEEYIKTIIEGKMISQRPDFYFCKDSPNSILLSAGSVLQMVDEVCSNKLLNGYCLVRPGGHHALRNRPMGFCFTSNAGLAAKYAKKKYGLKRILIIDWDVHHGNGTQTMIEDEESVLFISIQRDFYPFTGFNENVGKIGNVINIGFDKPYGTPEMKEAFARIIIPIAQEFDPQLLLITNGLDAVVKDPLGGCHVNPNTYGHLVNILMKKVTSRIILLGSTSYSVDQSVKCSIGCMRGLLGGMSFKEEVKGNREISVRGRQNIEHVLKIQSKNEKFEYFQQFRFIDARRYKKLDELRYHLVKEFGEKSHPIDLKGKRKESVKLNVTNPTELKKVEDNENDKNDGESGSGKRTQRATMSISLGREKKRRKKIPSLQNKDRK